jgi:hypothetical protein
MPLQGQSKIQICVRNLAGRCIGPIKWTLRIAKFYDVYPSDSVETLKDQVYEVTDIPPEKQRLIFFGKQLEDGIYPQCNSIIVKSNRVRT